MIRFGNSFATDRVASANTASFQKNTRSIRSSRPLWRQGGCATIDGGDKLDPETNNRVGLTFALPVKRRYSLKLIATTGVTATVGNDYNAVALAWQVVF